VPVRPFDINLFDIEHVNIKSSMFSFTRLQGTVRLQHGSPAFRWSYFAETVIAFLPGVSPTVCGPYVYVFVSCGCVYLHVPYFCFPNNVRKSPKIC
jgi:hypothetical protein